MNHLGSQELESQRLILRPFVMTDVDQAYQHWTSDPEVTKYLTWPRHQSPAVTKEVISQWVANYNQPGFYQWAIVLKASNEVIGSISAVDVKEKISAVHIGYAIGRKWWGLGITTEAFERIIPFFFDEVGVNRIESMHDPKNPASGKVMEHCGLVYEGTLRQADRNNQGLCDAAYYGLLREDYYR
ncbi:MULTISPECIES: GNAT family N-acetyltransferase [Aerococcus]|uniref:GNAT family N-acetyltransferase n=2 Tax=Aerococcus TaxID=1375 RepID=A0A1E9P9C8_9LACT|nr:MULTISPECIES: GNAT family N-acetyltransferase [Aerococcus]KAA9234431.1 GNAT family N-acetyltransferase [Aerococcus mictus]KAA9240073.1 GNAT family N-acetyltransferase [Aerococcus urinae]KAA9291540.1 GNAT family N-acetyltransferase [Aerococcus mictus]MBU5610230.1 GNAT family N-acetyltransferase [Aerococcus urinae]MCY3034841.1 GNAT family N-acetyltransferase [Aerococcus mictus]